MQEFYTPPSPHEKRERNVQIYAEKMAGATCREIAEKHQITANRVQQICNRQRALAKISALRRFTAKPPALDCVQKLDAIDTGVEGGK